MAYPPTLADYCRIHFYLVSAPIYGIRTIDAIHNAPTGNPWLPPSPRRDITTQPVNGHVANR